MFTRLTSLLLVAIFLVSCAPRAVPSAPVATEPALPSTDVVPSATASIPSRVPTQAPSPTPTLRSVVTISAVKGNLYIRRGPDVAFDPIAVLYAGQKATGTARDVLATWVQVALPENPDRKGWVSIQTIYSAVTGDVSTLPEVQPTDWPVPAFLRNCTFHNMTAEPGGILLPAVTNFPANDVRMNPGIYRVYDNDVEGYPEVLKVELREGSAIDVRVDGDGLKKKCPQP